MERTNSLSSNFNQGVVTKIAILREQGINGQTEMAAAFHQAYFDPYDVHMSDLTKKEKNLKDFSGIVFSSEEIQISGRVMT